jgi:hypothetical protein
MEPFLANADLFNPQAKVPLLSGTADPREAQKVSRAIKRWNSWLEEGIVPESLGTEIVLGDPTAENHTLVRRLFSRDEYNAVPGFGKIYGSASGQDFLRPSGVGPVVNRPPTVMVMGDSWASRRNIPSGWQKRGEATQEGVWEHVQGEGLVAHAARVRERLEEEIIALSEGFMALPSGSRVKYFSPLRTEPARIGRAPGVGPTTGPRVEV